MRVRIKMRNIRRREREVKTEREAHVVIRIMVVLGIVVNIRKEQKQLSKGR